MTRRRRFSAVNDCPSAAPSQHWTQDSGNNSLRAVPAGSELSHRDERYTGLLKGDSTVRNLFSIRADPLLQKTRYSSPQTRQASRQTRRLQQTPILFHATVSRCFSDCRPAHSPTSRMTGILFGVSVASSRDSQIEYVLCMENARWVEAM